MHKIEQHIELKWQHLKSTKIYVACSGGLDSTVLAFILKKLNFDVTVLHVNYQLRGEDSELDAKSLESFCTQSQIPFFKKVVALAEQLKAGGNLQELARKVRYNWFDEVLKNSDDAIIALAHHRNDQVETFLMNLSRKSGVLGLACMLEEYNRFIRPLLKFSKKEIELYATDKAINWREDKSNKSNKYRRNFLRNEVIPVLEKANTSFEKSVLILVDEFQKKQIELEQTITPIIGVIKKEHSLMIEDYLGLDSFEKNELLRQLGGDSNKVEEVNRLVGLENGKKVELNKTKPVLFSSIIKRNGYFLFESKELSKPTFKLVEESFLRLPEQFSKNEIYLNRAKINGKLELRLWKEGDRISPVGMKGSKLISDIIKDSGVSPLEKENILVLVDDTNLIWCVGLKVGRTVIAKNGDSDILKVKVIID